MPNDEPLPEEVARALRREGVPVWEEADFQFLLQTLGAAGFGWLTPDAVRQKLEEEVAEKRRQLEEAERQKQEKASAQAGAAQKSGFFGTLKKLFGG